MSDILCAVCGEPWDSYGVSHGDMMPWEAKLFRNGAGCPSCEGQGSVSHVEDHLRSVVVDGDEDPDRFTLLHGIKAPEWKRPEDEVIFSCAGCDSRVLKDQDDGELAWHTPTVDRYFHNRPGGHDWPTDRWYEIDGKKYCRACASRCAECREPIFNGNTSCTGTILYGDTYDPGSSFADPRSCYSPGICVSCFEAIPTCAHCSAVCELEELNDESLGPCCAEPETNEEDEECDCSCHDLAVPAGCGNCECSEDEDVDSAAILDKQDAAGTDPAKE